MMSCVSIVLGLILLALLGVAGADAMGYYNDHDNTHSSGD